MKRLKMKRSRYKKFSLTKIQNNGLIIRIPTWIAKDYYGKKLKIRRNGKIIDVFVVDIEEYDDIIHLCE